MPVNFISNIDNSLDSLDQTLSRTRWKVYPKAVACGTAFPTFSQECKKCAGDITYCHPFDSSTNISVQFSLGEFEIADLLSYNIQILDSNENVLRSTSVGDLNISLKISDDEGLRVSANIILDNVTETCIWIKGTFTLDGDVPSVQTYYSQQYCNKPCTSLVTLESEYREGSANCLGIYNDGEYRTMYTLKGTLEKQGFDIEDESYDNKGNKVYSEISEVYLLRAIVPENVADIIATILQGANITANGQTFYNRKTIEKNNDRNGMWIIEVELYKKCKADIRKCN